MDKQNRQLGRTFYNNTRIALIILCAGYAAAQQPACDHGVVKLPLNTNAPVEICSALAAQVPALAQQLTKLNQSLSTQQDQLKQLNRLITGMNSVSQNLGTQRQVQMLNNLASLMSASQKAGQEQTERKITALADGFDALKDQLVTLLTNRATADKATAGIEGSIGDDIARLDLSSAHAELEEIRTQLKAIGSDVSEVKQRTKEIQSTLEYQQMDAGLVANALASADVNALKRLSAASVPSSVLEEAFRRKADGKATVARRFFENSLNSPEVLKWFDSALANGLDPNLKIPGEYYEREAILTEAMRAGNAPAMKTLLSHGASPHPYQDLTGTSYWRTRFLFPFRALADDEHLTLQEKQEVAKSFLDAGLVIPKVFPPKGDFHTEMLEAKDLQEEVGPKLGLKLAPSPTLCEQPNTAICKRASSRSSEDWCSIIAKIPRRLTYDFATTHNNAPQIIDLNLLYVLNIDRDRIYYLGTADAIGPDYVLVEVSKDGSTWAVLKYMSDNGYGLCKPEDGYTGEQCWRRIPIHRVPGTDQMHYDRWGDAWKIAANSCGPTR